MGGPPEAEAEVEEAAVGVGIEESDRDEEVDEEEGLADLAEDELGRGVAEGSSPKLPGVLVLAEAPDSHEVLSLSPSRRTRWQR